MIYAKKSLGQHFLTSEKALNQIVSAAAVHNKDTILEIGPGRGALTQRLLDAGATVVAVEKDTDMVHIITESFKTYIAAGKLILVTGDILALDADTLDALIGDASYKLVANIPYYITGEIIRKFLSAARQPSSMTLLVQKEVAERIAREKKESILSLSVKVFGQPHYVATVPAGAFSPPPAVDSAIIHIQNINKEKLGPVEETSFFMAVKCGFSARRKQLKGNLKSRYTQESIESAFTACNLPETVRGEDVSCDVWIRLASLLKTN